MPKYGLDDTPETVPFIYACEGVRIDLRDCLVKSDCVTKDGKSPKECLKLPHGHPSVPDKCYSLRFAFFECKRSLLDMRQRFRGRKVR